MPSFSEIAVTSCCSRSSTSTMSPTTPAMMPRTSISSMYSGMVPSGCSCCHAAYPLMIWLTVSLSRSWAPSLRWISTDERISTMSSPVSSGKRSARSSAEISGSVEVSTEMPDRSRSGMEKPETSMPERSNPERSSDSAPASKLKALEMRSPSMVMSEPMSKVLFAEGSSKRFPVNTSTSGSAIWAATISDEAERSMMWKISSGV